MNIGQQFILGIQITAHPQYRPSLESDGLWPGGSTLYENQEGMRQSFPQGRVGRRRKGQQATPAQIRERIEEYEAAGLDLLLLQLSPQAEEMDRFAAQVIEPMRARGPELA